MGERFPALLYPSRTAAAAGIKRAAASHDRAAPQGVALGVQVTQQRPLWKVWSVNCANSCLSSAYLLVKCGSQ